MLNFFPGPSSRRNSSIWPSLEVAVKSPCSYIRQDNINTVPPSGFNGTCNRQNRGRLQPPSKGLVTFLSGEAVNHKTGEFAALKTWILTTLITGKGLQPPKQGELKPFKTGGLTTLTTSGGCIRRLEESYGIELHCLYAERYIHNG